MNGTLITTEGKTGLETYLGRTVTVQTLTTSKVSYTIIQISDGRIYYYYSSGLITTQDGTVVTRGGLTGLADILTSESTSSNVTLSYTTETPSY